MVTVILPTYNEKGNIIALIRELKKELSNHWQGRVEFVVIDDNSPDGTAQVVEELARTMPEIRLFVRKDERGLASAVKKGILEARGEILILMDTDFNHRPSDVPRLLEKFHDNDIVVGSRYIKGGWMESSWIRHYLSCFFNLFVRLSLGLRTTDNLSGFIAVKKSIFNTINLDEIFQGFGEYHIPFIWIAHQKNLRIREIPVIYNERTYGKSKFRPIENLINYTKTVLKLRAESRNR